MKHVRFYEEFQNKRRGLRAGNVFAAFTGNTFLADCGGAGREQCIEGGGAVFNYPNSPVAGTSASLNFLRRNCKRVSESRARQVHPRLFQWLKP